MLRELMLRELVLRELFLQKGTCRGIPSEESLLRSSCREVPAEECLQRLLSPGPVHLHGPESLANDPEVVGERLARLEVGPESLANDPEVVGERLAWLEVGPESLANDPEVVGERLFGGRRRQCPAATPCWDRPPRFRGI